MVNALLTSILVLSTIPAVKADTWDPNLDWDFQCHSHTHTNLQQLTASEIQWEMQQVDSAFQAQGYPPPNHHAYPYGGWDEDVKAVVSQYRLSGRMVWGFMVTYPIADWFELKAAQLKRTTSWNRIEGWINDCIADKALLHIFTHEVSDSSDQYGTTPAKLAQVLDYLVEMENAGLLTVVTMAEAYDYWSTSSTGEAMVVVSFDDAYVTDYTIVYPMFQNRGLKGTSYITTDWIGDPDRLTWDMIDDMRSGTAPPPKPDLTLTSNDITFAPATPSEGESVTITTSIHNIGTSNAYDIEVAFYDGSPSIENLIGTDIIASVTVGGSESASAIWTASPGNHEIFVMADPDNYIAELDDDNNEASKIISVPGEIGEMHVSNIEMACTKSGPRYTAHATVTIVDDYDNPVEGAMVYGRWTGAYTGDVSGPTGTNGQVTLSSGEVKRGGTYTLTVTDVAKVGWTYNPAQDIETSDNITCP